MHEAERHALGNGGVGEAHTAAVSGASVTPGQLETQNRAHDVMSRAADARSPRTISTY